MTNLTELTGTQLRARHLFYIAEARAAQSKGDNDEAYRLAMEVRRMNGEIALRRMLAAA